MCTVIEGDVKTAKTDNSLRSSERSIQLRTVPSSLICRICFDNETREKKLIRPCSCNGSVAYAHNECLERWVRATMNTKCTICQDDFVLVPVGLRNYSECTLPHPLSDEMEDVLDFWCSIAWIVYMSRFVFVGLRYGFNNMLKELDLAMGSGMIRSIWWISFWFNFLYYGAMTMLIYEKWMLENTVFSFKDRSGEKNAKNSTTTARNIKTERNGVKSVPREENVVRAL